MLALITAVIQHRDAVLDTAEEILQLLRSLQKRKWNVSLVVVSTAFAQVRDTSRSAQFDPSQRCQVWSLGSFSVFLCISNAKQRMGTRGFLLAHSFVVSSFYKFLFLQHPTRIKMNQTHQNGSRQVVVVVFLRHSRRRRFVCAGKFLLTLQRGC